MKLLFLLSALSLIFVSCSMDWVEDGNQTNPQLSVYTRSAPETTELPTRADSLFASFVIVEDNQYRLNLSLDEALNLGISQKEYEEAVFIMENVNRDICSTIGNGGRVTFAGQNDEIANYYNERSLIKTRSEELPAKQERYAGGTLPDGIASEYRFTGKWKLELRAGCTSYVWSVTFREANKNIIETLSGSLYSNPKTVVSAGTSDGNGNVYWSWSVTKGAGDLAVASVSFWSAPASR